MNNTAATLHALHSAVQKEPGTEHHMPAGAVHLDLVRVLETELQQRQLIECNTPVLNPLWFLAETERNVFLWRKGYSIEQADEFDFWIDLDPLIEKRLDQLSHFEEDNPFMNPLWGLSIADPDTLRREENYLRSLASLISQIRPHLEALSVAAGKVQREIEPEVATRAIVVLPAKRPRQKVFSPRS